MCAKLTNRQLQAIETKNKILNASIELFSDKGYDNVTIEEICNKINVSKGLFYNYFSSKSSVLISVFNDLDAEYSKLEESFTPADTSEERIHRMGKCLDGFVSDNEIAGQALRVAYIDALENKENYLFNTNRRLYSLVNEIVIFGQTKKEIREDIPNDIIEKFIQINIFGIYFYEIGSTIFDRSNEFETLFSLMYNAIKSN